MNAYNGYIEVYPIPEAINIGIFNFLGIRIGGNWIDPPAEVVAKITEFNTASQTTVKDVQDAGNTSDLIVAIQARAKLIKERVTQLTEYGQRLSPSDFQDSTGNTIAGIIGLIPGGAIVTGTWKLLTNGQDTRDFDTAIADTKNSLSAYQKDATELADLYKSAIESIQQTPNANDVPDNNNAPTPINWLWIGVGIIVLAVIIYAVSRKKK